MIKTSKSEVELPVLYFVNYLFNFYIRSPWWLRVCSTLFNGFRHLVILCGINIGPVKQADVHHHQNQADKGWGHKMLSKVKFGFNNVKLVHYYLGGGKN